jgi:hypothetical protein
MNINVSVLQKTKVEVVEHKEIAMAQIKNFVVETTLDLRGGRNSWRVLGALWSTALIISVASAVLHY